MKNIFKTCGVKRETLLKFQGSIYALTTIEQLKLRIKLADVLCLRYEFHFFKFFSFTICMSFEIE